MDVRTDTLPASRSDLWRARWQQLKLKLRGMALFAAGVIAALVGLLIYNAVTPAPQTLTLKDVNNAVAAAMASATPEPAYSATVYQIIAPSLVLIQASAPDAGGEVDNRLGSGVVISAEGDILTALHVVEEAVEIQVTFADGTQSLAQIVSTQPENDIAVLQADQPPEQIFPAVMGNPNAMEVGDEAYTIGNPFGLYASMSAGIISGFNRSFQAEGSETLIEGLIQVDTAVNPGNSGGPLLNRRGQVIGIVIGILNPTSEEFFIGIGFAVPITTAGGAAGAPRY